MNLLFAHNKRDVWSCCTSQVHKWTDDLRVPQLVSSYPLNLFHYHTRIIRCWRRLAIHKAKPAQDLLNIVRLKQGKPTLILNQLDVQNYTDFSGSFMSKLFDKKKTWPHWSHQCLYQKLEYHQHIYKHSIKDTAPSMCKQTLRMEKLRWWHNSEKRQKP